MLAKHHFWLFLCFVPWLGE